MSFIGATCRSMCEGLHITDEMKLKTVASPKADSSMSAESWKPGAHFTTFRQLNRLGSDSFRWFSSSEPFAGIWPGPCHLQVTQLPWGALSCLSKNLLGSSALWRVFLNISYCWETLMNRTSIRSLLGFRVFLKFLSGLFAEFRWCSFRTDPLISLQNTLHVKELIWSRSECFTFL